MEVWEQIEAVQRMQDFIDAHLQQPITLYGLARAANYSPWHCARMFKELVGETPFEYIRKLRLSQAALKMRDAPVKVLDVALDFVFDSHEGFTRAFSKQFGILPKNYQKSTPPIPLFIRYSVRDYHLILSKKEVDPTMSDKKFVALFTQVIDRPARKLILKRGKKAKEYFEYCSEVGCDVWGLLCSVKEALYEPIGLWLPESLRASGTSVYVQGVEVPADYANAVPAGFELLDLPPCKMMIFQGPPFKDEDFMAAIGDVWDAIKTYNPELYGFTWADEDAPRFQLAPQGYRGYIEARPVRALQYHHQQI